MAKNSAVKFEISVQIIWDENGEMNLFSIGYFANIDVQGTLGYLAF